MEKKFIGRVIESVNMANKLNVYDVTLGATISVRKARDWRQTGLKGYKPSELMGWEVLYDDDETQWFHTYNEAIKLAHEEIRNEYQCDISGYTYANSFSDLPSVAKAECLRIAKRPIKQ